VTVDNRVKQHEITLHAQQAEFRKSRKRYRRFIAGRGAGKTWILAFDLLMRASTPENAGKVYALISPTYTMLRDTVFKTLEKIGNQLGLIKDLRRGPDNMGVVLINGSEILCRSGDEASRLRGMSLAGAALDEGAQLNEEVFQVVIGCLREGADAWLSIVSTPRGRGHWTYTAFQDNPDADLFHCATTANPFLPDNFEKSMRDQLTSNVAAQEIDGQFVSLEGNLFRRYWFPLLDAAPECVVKVRAWDCAATVAEEGKEPDYTCGVLMGRTPNNQYVILDVRRVRETPQVVEQLIRRTAEEDGYEVSVWTEEEPGSAGKIVTDHFRRNVLAGFAYRAERSTGDKITRAQPFAAMSEGGNVKILRASWTKTLLDEIESFPEVKHDDQVDACSLCYSKLARRGPSAPDAEMVKALDEGHARYARTHANLELRQRTHRGDSAGARWLAAMSAGSPFGFKPIAADEPKDYMETWFEQQYSS
jgi:predicted phage terminase large subunit-like protein